jgi:nitrite reductase/ring-hydroxylating ferredoxin subunit
MDAESVNFASTSQLAGLIAANHASETKIKVAALSEMPPVGECKEFRLGNKTLCVANVGGEICATNNTCPHLGARLSRGRIRDGKIVCPSHGWPFDPKTGETPVRPTTRAQIYQVSVEGENVFVCPAR